MITRKKVAPQERGRGTKKKMRRGSPRKPRCNPPPTHLCNCVHKLCRMGAGHADGLGRVLQTTRCRHGHRRVRVKQVGVFLPLGAADVRGYGTTRGGKGM